MIAASVRHHRLVVLKAASARFPRDLRPAAAGTFVYERSAESRRVLDADAPRRGLLPDAVAVVGQRGAVRLFLVRRCSEHVTTSSVCTAQAVAVVLSMRDAATMQVTAAANKGSKVLRLVLVLRRGAVLEAAAPWCCCGAASSHGYDAFDDVELEYPRRADGCDFALLLTTSPGLPSEADGVLGRFEPEEEVFYTTPAAPEGLQAAAKMPLRRWLELASVLQHAS